MPNLTLNNLGILLTPSTFDRADGNSFYLYPGTPAPAGAIKLNYGGSLGTNPYGDPIIFEEYSDSPEIESGEQSTIVHKFHCDRYTAEQMILANPRGTLLVDSTGLFFSRVLTSKISPIARTGAKEWMLIITCESLSFGTPPDEFDIEIVELNPPAEKHPRYASLSYYQRNIIRGADVSDDQAVAQSYKDLISTFSSSVNPAQDQKGQAKELLFKKEKGEDSFYLSGYRVSWSTYFYAPVTINPGGYMEDPVLEGALPYQFWAVGGDIGNGSIFQETTLLNPNVYPTFVDEPPYGLSWLRYTDTLHLQRTWFKLTRTWVGAPLGHWDNEWYNVSNGQAQPLQTEPSQGGLNLGGI